MIGSKRDPIVNALKAAREAGAVGTRLEIVGHFPEGERRPGLHKPLWALCERYGMTVRSSGSGTCCLPCKGSGSVDDATAVGCVRSSMRCPTCLGRGDFYVVAFDGTPTPVKARPDGWPLCPVCGEDELGCLATPQPPEYEWPIERYLEHELFCYRCGRVTWTP